MRAVKRRGWRCWVWRERWRWRRGGGGSGGRVGRGEQREKRKERKGEKTRLGVQSGWKLRKETREGSGSGDRKIARRGW